MKVLAIVFALVAITHSAPPNPCDPNPCVRGACTRSSDTLGFSCNCEEGFSGDTCQNGPCDSNPCAEGICLTSAVSSRYTCLCPAHRGGTNCEIALNGCDSNPCLNGGMCMTSNSNAMRYVCVCASGYSGVTCENELQQDGCDSNPCLNSGSCLSSSVDPTRYVCVCASGFSGRVCENGQAAPCDSSPCLNGGSCTLAAAGGYRCTCSPQFVGAQCQQPNLACASVPCMNGGSCQTTTGGGYFCVCEPLYTGTHCEGRIDPCLNNPCHNGGTCQPEAEGGYNCKCDSQFGGAQCQQQMTCALNPCKNGGSCYLNFNDGINYMCKCPDNYKGKDCSKPDPCSSNPCSNNSVCLTEEDGSYSCLCRCGTDGSCSTNNGEDGGTSPSVEGPECSNLMRASGDCTGRGECSFDANRQPYCRCDASYYGTHCQYVFTETPNGGGNTGESTTTSGGDEQDTFNTNFMCPESTDYIGCRFVFSEMNKCNNRGCCSSDLRGGAKCSCVDGYGGNQCQFDCVSNPNGCGSSDENAGSENEVTRGTEGAGTGGGGVGTGGTGANGEGVRTLVEQEPVICTDVPSQFPILECGRVWIETGMCSNQGCCSVDEDGDARCRCNGGFGGPHCEFNCAFNPDGCGTANGAGGSDTGGAGTGGAGTGGAGTGGAGTGGAGTRGTGANGEGVRTQVEQEPVICTDVPSQFPILECGRVWTETGMCSNQGCCSVDEDGDARCRCNGGFGGPHCEFNCAVNPDGCGTANGAGGSNTGGAGTGGAGTGGTGANGEGVRTLVEQEPVICTDVPSQFPILECGRVWIETGMCSNQGCCSVDEDGDARCRCNGGFGGPHCEFNCAVNPDGCGTANGAGGSNTGGAGTGGAGTGGTGANGEGVRTLVEQEPVICTDAPSQFPILECGRVWIETGMCSNQGCCSVDEDGDARCRCNGGFGGPHCEFNCAVNPDGCGTAN